MKTDALIILDGYGLSDNTAGNAIAAANTPFLDYLTKNYPYSRLTAGGLDVGLPAGQMGNSEVGHLNIGAGRAVYQDITAIDNAIDDGDFFANPAFVKAMKNAKNGSGRLHLAGLCSDGGVHSSLNHLYALLAMAKKHGIKEVLIHCVTDGRDTPPKSAAGFVAQIEAKCKEIGVGRIATVVGRYYFMDRDNRWERLEKGYNCIFEGEGRRFDSANGAPTAAYKEDVTDEFLFPCVIGGYDGLKHSESFIFFNFRADRAREITQAATNPDFDKFTRKSGFLFPLYVGMTQYDASFKGLYTAFKPKSLKNTLGEFLSKSGKTQARIAETEKYAHVTFFLSGGVEKAVKGEQRRLIPSPKVTTYDLVPEMSAKAVADKAVSVVGGVDALILNFANCDMVGHTGVYDAAVKAVETVDTQLKRVVDAVLESGGTALVTSDHGNAERMIMPDGTPMTAHTTNLVPLWLVGEKFKGAKLNDGRLCDLAPTLLEVMGLDKPAEMTGRSLIVNA
ncbi:MAG: 2,3-bisphosphoglycerate-independent phosphoglycerate mutase [Firmicutes bacterium]|nr:2,3-bisphosphoglycerate-independent phosphoglycerate mutase [Bacillota bacterium]